MELYQKRYPVEKPVAACQLIHGLAEHQGRYLPFIEWLNGLGIEVFTHDHPGHGRNVPEEERVCHIGGPGAWRDLVEPTRDLTLQYQAEHPGRRLLLFGHSMGSLTLRRYLMEFGGELDPSSTGILLSGTGMVPPTLAKVARRLFLLMHGSGAGPEAWAKVRPLFNKVFFGSLNRGFKSKMGGHAWLSPDPEAGAEYDKDPLCKEAISDGTFLALLDLVLALDEPFPESVPRDLPMLILAGAEDPFGEQGKGPTELHRRYVLAGMNRVELEVFEGLRHELVNHSEAPVVWARVLEWLTELGWVEGAIDSGGSGGSVSAEDAVEVGNAID